MDDDVLLRAFADAGHGLDRQELDDIVATSDKQRFAFDPTRTRIRAQQGHSVEVELGLEERKPPERLFHGTVAAALGGIMSDD